MISEYNTFIVLTIWQYFAESALNKTILTKDVLSLIFMKLRKCVRCIVWILKWIRNNLKKEKINLAKAVSHKRFKQIKLLAIQNGFWREEILLSKDRTNRRNNNSSNLLCFSNNKWTYSKGKLLMGWIQIKFSKTPKC